MIWDNFITFAVVAVICWVMGAVFAWKSNKKLAYTATVIGTLVLLAFIIGLWTILDRPPMRTMGETRLWYSLFLPVAGLIIYSRFHYKWVLSVSTVLAVVFVCVNIFKPEIHSKTLMPALQSPWFAPHVIVYMMAYSMLGAAAVMSLYLLFVKKNKRFGLPEISACDSLVYIGYAFLTFGMLMGALWAKDAWGHYWAWDPKETWAAVTWFAYLGYMHLRIVAPEKSKTALWTLIICFILLQMCWWGINYLPSAQGSSVHTYYMNN